MGDGPGGPQSGPAAGLPTRRRRRRPDAARDARARRGREPRVPLCGGQRRPPRQPRELQGARRSPALDTDVGAQQGVDCRRESQRGRRGGRAEALLPHERPEQRRGPQLRHRERQLVSAQTRDDRGAIERSDGERLARQDLHSHTGSPFSGRVEEDEHLHSHDDDAGRPFSDSRPVQVAPGARSARVRVGE